MTDMSNEALDALLARLLWPSYWKAAIAKHHQKVDDAPFEAVNTMRALRQQLAAAEAAALERAATWCTDEADACDDAAKWGGAKRYVDNCKAASFALRNASSKIRSLITPEAASALEAVKTQARKEAVKVKPLVWIEGWGGSFEDIPMWEGRSSTGMSFGFSAAGRGYTTHAEAPAEWVASGKSRLDGIYEARIRAALEGGE